MANLYVEDGYVSRGFLQTGITINWATGEIFVPKSELTLVQSTPSEIYELNLNAFRLALKDLEDDPEGMPFTLTHLHNTEVTLGGLTYARVIEIIEPYTVTFEDGQYAVNLVGANSNVGDRINVNQVSVRSANSAGMTSSPDIEYSSFNGAVTINVTSSYSGTSFPIGTPRKPVNNIADARLIKEYRGLPAKFRIMGNITIGVGDNIDGYTIEGEEPSKSTITVLTESQAYGCVFTDCMLTGVLDGNSTVKDSVVFNLSYVYGFVYNCLISEVGEITLGGDVKAYFLNCYSGKGTVHGSGFPTINCGGSGPVLVMHNYNGDISLKDKTGTEAATINLNAGAIELQASCTNGTIECQGTGSLEDYTGVGCSVYSEDLMNAGNISKAVLNTHLTDYDEPETVGLAFVKATYNGNIYIDAVNGVAGTEFPLGLISDTVSNVEDALVLANKYACSVIHFHSDYNVTNGVDLSHKTILSHFYNITVDNTVNCAMAVFSDVVLSGIINGDNVEINHCNISDLTFRGHIHNSVVIGTLTPSGDCTIADCTGGIMAVSLTVDMSVNGFEVRMPNWKGNVSVINLTNGFAGVNILAGTVTLDPSCSGGISSVSGSGYLVDNSTGTTVYSSIINKDTISESVWSIPLSNFNEYDTMGSAMNDISYTTKKIYINTELVDNGNGKMSEPFNNVADAVDFAESIGWSVLAFLADATLERNLRNFTLEGIGLPTIDLNGQDVNRSEFHNVYLTGIQLGSIVAENCILNDGMTGLDGTYKNVGIVGDISLAEDSHVNILSSCKLFVVGSVAPSIIDMGATNTNVTLNIRKMSGALSIINTNTITKLATIEFDGGRLYIDDTNTDGFIAVTGIVDTSLFDTSNGTTVHSFGLIPSATTNANAAWSHTDAIDLISDTQFIKDIEGGRWQITNDQMIFFAEDNTTEVARFNLLDQSGNPTETNVFQRVRQ